MLQQETVEIMRDTGAEIVVSVVQYRPELTDVRGDEGSIDKCHEAGEQVTLRAFRANSLGSLERQMRTFYWPLRPRGISKASLASALRRHLKTRQPVPMGCERRSVRARGGFMLEQRSHVGPA
jgi:hypothetical protein